MAVCIECQNPLVVEVERDEDDELMVGSSSSAAATTTVPDDVELGCGCHFHWQCLLDIYSTPICPHCGTLLLSTSQIGEDQLLCILRNEGGVQEGLDILPLLTEEAYLNTHPGERKGRAFLEFCREGDIEAIVDLLGDIEEDNDGEEIQQGAEESGAPIDVLRYQDPIGGFNSALHVAVLSEKVEVAWLLLLVASNLEPQIFPNQVLQAAEQFGLFREDQSGKLDIRALRDAEDRTAEEVAASVGGVWRDWLGTGRLAL
ncbi:hypothetical protein L228DRAFT_241317 [Xylona heveae TC161]|uniref:Uncharacterized protein n=1 Tax=Xylona heveae (strain CBS 132557 / TC161) TaxID=1328760 RepID=A0A165A9J2_XYLHT|nr:hypothetical protein L228DRAFT_241317 [Xylona heveae TC161]KZF20132.1 hypothetical protein L228DRAFT_241317 [Xylona heveae TC161]